MKLDLLNYFLYLRDVSHKIAVSADWTKCLRERTTKGIKSVKQYSLDEIEKDFSIRGKKQSIKDLYRYQVINSEKEIFLGLGCIYGINTKASNKKQLLGSLFNIPVSYEMNEEKMELKKIHFDIENLILNYNVFLNFFENPNDNVFSSLNDIVNDIEDFFLDTNLNNDNFQLQNINLLNEQIRIKTANFFKDNGYLIEQVANKLEDKVSLIKEEAKIDFDNVYVFAFDVPDEISTWKYLDGFCKELQSGGDIDSKVLNNILSDEEVDKNDIGFQENIFDLLPLNLSDKQKESIKNAFTERVSYVQGPPGTGKSHTITGMALTALMLGQKVLIISQKDTALKVIKSKLDQHLSSLRSKNILPYIYFDKSMKRTLKNDFEKFLEKNKTNSFNTIESIKNDLGKDYDLIEDLLHKQFDFENLIAADLNKQYEFSKSNSEYLRDSEDVNNLINYKKDLSVIELVNNNEGFLTVIKNIEKEYSVNKKLKKYTMFMLKSLNKHFNIKFSSSINFTELLKDGLLSIYIEKILLLSRKINDVNQKQRDLAPKRQIDLINSNKLLVDKKLEEMVVPYFNKHLEFHILNEFSKVAQNKKDFDNFQNFAKMLHFKKADVIIEKLKAIKFEKILNVFNLWMCEIRHIGEVLPNQKELFDLIIMDESSQVNTAEIFPILYRGKNVCVVGDEKQLGLESVGLNFIIGTKEEQQIWDNYLGKQLFYEQAKMRDFVVTKSSFLELITSNFSNRNYVKTMLDEHFRSMPQLAHYTNKRFYNGDLKVMTETPDKSLVHCFQAIKVDGKRIDGKNPVESKKVIDVIKYIIGIEENKDFKRSIFEKDKSVGVISLLREQVDYIKEDIFEKSGLICEKENDYIRINGVRVKCGTPEELQGDEFDYVIISAVVDKYSRNTGHYTNDKRLNVGTSRAKYFTYLVYTDISRVPFFVNYLENFGVQDFSKITDCELVGWSYDPDKLESGFEKYVAKFLENTLQLNSSWKLFNQVNFAHKRIDFVIFNQDNKKYVAIEVDGQFHFTNNTGRIYSQEHRERALLLSRAGWKIIHTPYYYWFQNGRIDETSESLMIEKERIVEEIKNYLK